MLKKHSKHKADFYALVRENLRASEKTDFPQLEGPFLGFPVGP